MEIKNIEILINKLDFNQVNSVLDLGCGSFLKWFSIFDWLNSFEAVDRTDVINKLIFELEEEFKNTKKLSLEEKLKFHDQFEEEKDTYKIYEFYFDVILKKEKIPKEKFEKILKISHKSILEFITNPKRKFDLVVISKVLSHLPEDSKKNPEKIIQFVYQNFLNEKGFLFLRLNGEGYTVETFEDNFGNNSSIRQIFSEKRIKKMIERYPLFFGPKKLEIEKVGFGGNPNHLVYEYILILEKKRDV